MRGRLRACDTGDCHPRSPAVCERATRGGRAGGTPRHPAVLKQPAPRKVAIRGPGNPGARALRPERSATPTCGGSPRRHFLLFSSHRDILESMAEVRKRPGRGRGTFGVKTDSRLRVHGTFPTCGLREAGPRSRRRGPRPTRTAGSHGALGGRRTRASLAPHG